MQGSQSAIPDLPSRPSSRHRERIDLGQNSRALTKVSKHMVPRPEIYREKAEECERLAASARDAAVRRQLLMLAQQWQQMAKEAEKSLDVREG